MTPLVIFHQSREYYLPSKDEANIISIEKDLGIVFDKNLKFTC